MTLRARTGVAAILIASGLFALSVPASTVSGHAGVDAVDAARAPVPRR
jgi:hypothetical protein